MGHLNVLEEVEDSVTDSLMLEDTELLLRNVTVTVVVTDIQVTGDIRTGLQGVTGAQEDLRQGTEAEGARQEAGVHHGVLPIVVVVIAAALCVAVLQLQSACHLLAQVGARVGVRVQVHRHQGPRRKLVGIGRGHLPEARLGKGV